MSAARLYPNICSMLPECGTGIKTSVAFQHGGVTTNRVRKERADEAPGSR